MKSSATQIIIFLFLLSLSTEAVAQRINPLPVIAGAKEDINYLGGKYLGPVGVALGNGLNNSWYSSARVHSLLGFHLNIAPSLVIVPSDDQTFVIENSKLKELELVDERDNIAPTAFGPNEDGPLLRSKAIGNFQTFNSPAGVGFSFLPLANINLGVGVGFNTEVDVRYFPKSQISGLEDAKIGLFGFGAIHEVSQWFMDDDEPAFSLSVQAGFSSISYEQPIKDGDDGQELTMKSNGTTFRGIISKQFSFFTLYGGVGYNSADTDINLRGTYSYQPPVGPATTITDPISINTTANSVVFNLGGRILIAEAISIFADYTYAQYSSITLGLGVDLNFE